MSRPVAYTCPDSLLDRLYDGADAGRWPVTRAAFASALARSVEHAGMSDDAAAERFLEGLHLADLALATACAEGSVPAWDHFVEKYRPMLHRAADGIDSGGGARELADGLYAELFGVSDKGGQRQSLVRYFHGRSSLATWLRAVLAQRHVDRIRATRRFEPLVEDGEAPSAATVDPPTDRRGLLGLMRRAVSAAVARLAPRDRLRLACYYAQNLTLAETGRLLAEHEATVSRHLTRARQAIRQDVERQLDEAGLDAATVDECFAAAVEEAGRFPVAEWMGSHESRKAGAGERSKSTRPVL